MFVYLIGLVQNLKENKNFKSFLYVQNNNILRQIFPKKNPAKMS